MKYATGYTGFSGDPDLQEGNFIALKMSAPMDATTTVEVLGGHSGPVELDSDMNAVLRIENKYSQKIKVETTTTTGVKLSKIFSLSSLKCEEEE